MISAVGAALGLVGCIAPVASDPAEDAPDPPGPVIQVALGKSFSCGLRSTGEVVCWGGPFGRHGCPETRPRPVTIPGVEDAVDLAVAGHACAVESTGGVRCWGQNWTGQLGDGTRVDSERAAVAVVGLDDAEEVALGTYRSCARRAGGEVVCWGRDPLASIEDRASDRLTPVAVPPVARPHEGEPSLPRTREPGPIEPGPTELLAEWPRPSPLVAADPTEPVREPPPARLELPPAALEIASGSGHTCARQPTGHVVCWGTNPSGQLGDGTYADRSAPARVRGLSDAVQITAGGSTTCALRATGSVVCWGRHATSPSPSNPDEGLPLPAPVADLHEVVQISAGREHRCALRATGDVYCWGDNRFRQLAQAGTARLTTPTRVRGLHDVVEIVAGPSNQCARRSSGELVCWGYSVGGLLGEDTHDLPIEALPR